jgi:hypothetical protein
MKDSKNCYELIVERIFWNSGLFLESSTNIGKIACFKTWPSVPHSAKVNNVSNRSQRNSSEQSFNRDIRDHANDGYINKNLCIYAI